MVEIHVIDFHQDRRKYIARLLKTFYNDDKVKDFDKIKIWRQNFDKFPDKLLLFLHSSNDNGQGKECLELLEDIVNHNIGKDLKILLYSGGAPKNWSIIEKLKKTVYEIKLTNYKKWSFKWFFEKWKNRMNLPHDLAIIDLNLSLLLYRIAHLFLPLDIDLMGICEVLGSDFEPPEGKNKEVWAANYYNEAFGKESPKDKFKKLVEEAREIINELAPDDKKEEILKQFKNTPDLTEFNSGMSGFMSYAKNPEQNPFHKWFCEVTEKLENLLQNS